jgi:hypothetical protein
MSPAVGVPIGVVAAIGAFGLWRALQRTSLREQLSRPNVRGVRLSLTLGVAIAAGVVAGIGAVAAVVATRDGWGASAGPELLGAAIVVLAGLVDDVVPGRARGLRGHVAELGRGRVTTGILKVAAAVLAAVLVVADAGGSGWERLAGVALVAGCTNLWNLLDVRPGRAVKAYVVGAGALVVAEPGAVLLAASIPVVALGWFDLRERGMLGDTGANVLGFVIGAEAYLRLPGPAVAVAAGLVVVLTLLAETVTLSRAIDAVAPLRWFDRLGRIRPIEAGIDDA